MSFYNFKYATVDINFENLKTVKAEITKSEEGLTIKNILIKIFKYNYYKLFKLKEYVSLGYYGGYGRYIIYSSEFKASTTLIGLEIVTSAATSIDLVVCIFNLLLLQQFKFSI